MSDETIVVSYARYTLGRVIPIDVNLALIDIEFGQVHCTWWQQCSMSESFITAQGARKCVRDMLRISHAPSLWGTINFTLYAPLSLLLYIWEYSRSPLLSHLLFIIRHISARTADSSKGTYQDFEPRKLFTTLRETTVYKEDGVNVH